MTVSNIQLDLGQLLASTQAGLTAQIQPLVNAANQLTSPISGLPSWTHDVGLDNLTALDLLNQAGQFDSDFASAANQIQAFASEITSLENLTTQLKDSARFTGSMTFHIAADGSLSPGVTGGTGLLSLLQADLNALKTSAGVTLPFLESPGQLASFFLAPSSADLIEYTVPTLTVNPITVTIPLADFPTPIPASDVEISLYANFSISAGATVVFNSVGLQSGNLAAGFRIQNQQLSANFSVGLSGTYWEAYVVGYEVAIRLGSRFRISARPHRRRLVRFCTSLLLRLPAPRR